MTVKEAAKHVPCWFIIKNSEKSPAIISYVTKVKPHSDAVGTSFIIGNIQFSFTVHEYRDIIIATLIKEPKGTEGIIASELNKNLELYTPNELIRRKMAEAIFDED
jgi:hypothetical protein